MKLKLFVFASVFASVFLFNVISFQSYGDDQGCTPALGKIFGFHEDLESGEIVSHLRLMANFLLTSLKRREGQQAQPGQKFFLKGLLVLSMLCMTSKLLTIIIQPINTLSKRPMKNDF